MRRSRSTEEPARRVVAPLLVAGLVAAFTLLLGAAPAQAGAVTPLADCYTDNGNGTYTAVLGYSNTSGRAQKFAVGTSNNLSPSKFNGMQPTSFKAGTYHGVFSVTFTVADAYNAGWTLDGTSLTINNAGSVGTCPPGTQMPADGNGTGAVVALLAAGVVGVLLVRRVRRRNAVAA